MLYDVFISHASEDKDDFVRPLAEMLKAHHIEVWYDEFELTIGGSLRESIDKGLSSSRFGIVVLSTSFFEKRWPNRELNGLVARETIEDSKLILPIWHNVDRTEVAKYSPPLADVLAISSSSGINAIVRKLLKKLRPEESPLIVARDLLIDKGWAPPVISDEWWLDIIEIKEAEFLHPDLNADWRWIFPLPFPNGHRGKERGLNIGWTALQLDWAYDAKERKICQLTRPEVVHDFIQKWPGLFECAHQNPEVLSLYAPQLTLEGFDDGFSIAFDSILGPECIDICDSFRYGRADTIDGKEPLCGDFVAWRHPTFGNYTPAELSYEFVKAHTMRYSREVFSGFECVVWLLSEDANWLPNKIRETLLQGMRDRAQWWLIDSHGYGHDFIEELVIKPQSKFKLTKRIKSSLWHWCDYSIQQLEIDADADSIAAKFVDFGFIDGYYDEQRRYRRARRK